jgi:integrase
MHFSVTAYLLSLADADRNALSIWQYSRILTDFLGVLADANKGRGVDWKAVDDEFLERWKFHLIDQRGVSIKTFKSRLAVVLRWLIYSEENGWVAGLVGDGQSGNPARVTAFRDGSFIRHQLAEGEAHEPTTDLISHTDFRLIDAEIDRAATRNFTRQGRRLLGQLMRTAALRRSEALRLRLNDIPSRQRLDRLRESVGCGKALPLVTFKIIGSKRGNVRRCQISLSLASNIRAFIDGPRAKILAAKGFKKNIAAEVFISQKTCKALTPQAITNFWKTAAHAAARRWGRPELAQIRPHHSRHRGITDFARTWLDAGKSPAETMIAVMNFAGLKQLSTASVYLHLAHEEHASALPAMRTTLVERDREMQNLLMLGRLH